MSAEAAVARSLIRRSGPGVSDVHLFRTTAGAHCLLVDGSRVFTVDEDVFGDLQRASSDPMDLARLIDGLDFGEPLFDDRGPPIAPPVRALSLAVAQKCNLGCTYCYAQGGDFGGPPANMSIDVAFRAVDYLFNDAAAGDRVSLAFLGGEPLVNRPVLRAATERAADLARARGVRLALAITTNGTLVTADDGEFFERHGFAVTVSLDGPQASHDKLRMFRDGRGSFDTVVANVAPLLTRQRAMQVSARVTVTPRNLQLRSTLDTLIGMGFHSVGFSPLLSSPTGCDQLESGDLETMLEQMVDCGTRFERAVVAGERFPFANAVNAMREIHRGSHRPYPCGAGVSYFGVSAEGDLAACHRFVGDDAGTMGSLREDVAGGVARDRQARWLADRHVESQEPCRSCWARYLCGGGCHHEVIRRGRPACDFIRGWLHYCLEAYVRLLERRPDYFEGAERPVVRQETRL